MTTTLPANSATFTAAEERLIYGFPPETEIDGTPAGRTSCCHRFAGSPTIAGTTWTPEMVWEYWSGPVPMGAQLSKVCDNARCVAPMHRIPVWGVAGEVETAAAALNAIGAQLTRSEANLELVEDIRCALASLADKFHEAQEWWTAE